MENIRQKIAHVRQNPHCVNCGSINPAMIEDGDLANAYTKCCNEKLCERNEEFTWGNDKVTVQACCWAVAELEFIAQGIDVTQQHGMYRFN